MNQLRQLALACLNYESSLGALPAAVDMHADFNLKSVTPNYDVLLQEALKDSTNQEQTGHSWIVEILPYIEQQSLADQYDKQASVLYNIRQREFPVVDIPELYCPTRRARVQTPEEQEMLILEALGYVEGGTDYGCNFGTGNCFRNDGRKPLHLGWGCVGRSGEAAGPMTPLREGTGGKLRKVIDGTSNTILLAELQRIWADGTSSGTSGVAAGRSQDGWLFGGAATSFSTAASVLFSNGSLMNDASPSTGGINSGQFEGPGSEHAGGANIAMVDASVQFMSEDIDPLIFMAMGTRAGAEVITDSSPEVLFDQLEGLFKN